MRLIVLWCLRRRSVVALATLLVLGAGVLAASDLRQQFFPDVDFPFVIVDVEVTGLDAAQVDEQVAQPLAAVAGSLDEVQTTQTLASDGRAALVTELDYATDTQAFEEDLARELAAVPLPQGAGELDIGGGFDQQAVLNAALGTDGELTELTDRADDIRDELEAIEGVGRVELEGGAEEEYAVEIDEAAVRRGQAPARLAAQVEAAVSEAPVGLVVREGSRTPLLVDPGAVGGREDLEKLPIFDGRKLGDVAAVRRQAAQGEGFARTDGQPSIALSLYAAEDANEVEVVDEAQAVLARAARELPQVEVDTIFETASDVKASVQGLLLEGVLGACLAVVVIFLFLRSVRPTLVAAVSIPTSIVCGLLAASALGLSLNIITLAGLTIAIGRVIDDAIVVLESIHQHLERGEPRMQAALEGTTEVANAIVSSTLATAAVFLPLGLVGGLVSEIFFSFSVIVAVALLASLLVALTVIPALGATFMRPRATPSRRPGLLARTVTPVTRFGIRPVGRLVVIVAAVAALAGTIGVVASGGIAVQFLPDSGTQQAFGTVDLPAGVGAERAARLLRPLEDRLRAVEGVRSAQVTFGGAGVQIDPVEDTGDGAFFVNFEEGVDVGRVVAELRRFGEREYPAGFTADRLEQGPPAGEFEATVVGEDQQAAERGADRVTELLERRDDVAQVESEAADEQTQFVLEVDAGERGTPAQAGATRALAALLPSARAGAVGDEAIPVVVRAPQDLLQDADALEDVPLPPAAGGPPAAPPPRDAPETVGDVGDVEREQAAGTRSRVDGEPAVRVTARALGADVNAINQAIEGQIDDLGLSGARVEIGGDQEFIDQMFSDLGLAMLAAVALVYLVLVVFFGSTSQPVTILAPILFSSIGSLLALYVTGAALGLPAMIGQLLLIGIVVANSILLVDTALRRRRAGVAGAEALVEAARMRVRPVLMTALATMAALLPLAAGLSGEGGIISRSLGAVVIGGLLTATLLTLVMVPAVSSTFDAAGRMLRRLVGHRSSAPSTSPR
ncbi:MAG TPA: efflux RND transporter permease subunit [Solirubrobacteraceae bacterium]|nr:efflux RND transporter permease subunit [Solirubrobacteraceae bacterium]